REGADGFVEGFGARRFGRGVALAPAVDARDVDLLGLVAQVEADGEELEGAVDGVGVEGGEGGVEGAGVEHRSGRRAGAFDFGAGAGRFDLGEAGAEPLDVLGKGRWHGARVPRGRRNRQASAATMASKSAMRLWLSTGWRRALRVWMR